MAILLLLFKYTICANVNTINSCNAITWFVIAVINHFNWLLFLTNCFSQFLYRTLWILDCTVFAWMWSARISLTQDWYLRSTSTRIPIYIVKWYKAYSVQEYHFSSRWSLLMYMCFGHLRVNILDNYISSSIWWFGKYLPVNMSISSVLVDYTMVGSSLCGMHRHTTCSHDHITWPCGMPFRPYGITHCVDYFSQQKNIVHTKHFYKSFYI